MEDVRKAAQSRAARENRAPLGTSFESERRRSKNALVKQISSQDGRNVRMIAAAAETPEEERILRVAAYCRVSTDDIDQALSIHLQIQQYMKKIKENPNWKYAAIFCSIRKMCVVTGWKNLPKISHFILNSAVEKAVLLHKRQSCTLK